jgi:ubiquinone/menaquinone biosynthesis C-methylase UbiE
MNGSELTRSRYDRIASVYDAIDWVMEWWYRGWREELWQDAPTGRILEDGVGTGKNLAYHRSGQHVTGVDLSPAMLNRARRRAETLGSDAVLLEADVQELPFDDDSFDAACATFVFCSVPDPVRGLEEIRRVVRPGGTVLLLEHVLSEHWWLTGLMKLADPLPLHIWGAHIDRDTVANVRAAGLGPLEVHPRLLDIFVQIRASVPKDPESSRNPPG